MSSWGENYYRIVNRYEATVVGQFFGHTHNAEIEMFYDLAEPSRAVSVAYLASSVTTFANLSPSYRIYTVDGDYAGTSWQVLDFETYYLNLTEANASGQATWKLEYSAKVSMGPVVNTFLGHSSFKFHRLQDAFKMNGLLPEDWSALVKQMESSPNGTLASEYIKHYFTSSDALYSSCDLACRKATICRLKQARSDKLIACRL